MPAREELGLHPGEAITAGTLAGLLIAGGLTKKMNTVIGSLIAEEGLWTEAMDLAMSGDDKLAFRASWGLEWAYSTNTESFGGFIPRFVEDLLRTRNHSVNRVYSKMLCDMMRRGALRPDTAQAEKIAEKAFDLLISPDTPTAVRAWQVELLADLRGTLDWVEENLTAIVRDMSEKPDCSPGEAAQARHYFRMLEKEKKNKNSRSM